MSIKSPGFRCHVYPSVRDWSTSTKTMEFDCTHVDQCMNSTFLKKNLLQLRWSAICSVSLTMTS